MPFIPIKPLIKQGIRAYHGSPHDFDKFSMEQIGTGEGAQAYGHGLYFAENEGVARNYRNNLSYKQTVRNFMESLPDDAEFEDVLELIGTGHFTEKQDRVLNALADDGWLGFDYPSQAISAAHSKQLDNWDPSNELRNAIKDSGQMYEVNINANPDDFLDWDAPLSEQPEGIARLLEGKENRFTIVGPDGKTLYKKGLTLNEAEQYINDFRSGYSRQDGNPEDWKIVDLSQKENLPNQPIYDVFDIRNAKSTSELAQAGIPGIKYLDGGSRGKGEGTYNYVVFDEKNIEIIRKYGIAGAIASGLLTLSTEDEAQAAGFGEMVTGVGVGRGATLAISQHDNPDPSFMETLKAAWQRENLVGSTLSSNRSMMDNQEFFEIDPDYNPYDDLEGYEEHEDKFVDVFNKKAADAVKADIDRERKNDESLAASGWLGVGLSMGAAVADPTILVPGGAFVKAGRVGQVGFSAGRSALKIGAAAAGATAIQEAGLQATQQTRPLGESALNVSGSAVLGGLIGAAGAKFFSKGEWDKVAKAIETDLTEEVIDPADIAQEIVKRAQSAGAASVDDIKLDDLGVAGPKAAKALAKATAAVKLNPGVRTMLSPSLKSRSIYNQLVEGSVYTNLQAEGRSIGPAVESLVKKTERGGLAKFLMETRKIYKDMRKAGVNPGMKQHEFYEAAGRASRRMDSGENEYISRAAKSWRDNLANPLKDDAIKVKLLDEGVAPTTAPSYLHRMWNKSRLLLEEGRFRGITKGWLRGQYDKAMAADKDSFPEFVSDADRDDYLDEIIDSIHKNLTGKGSGDFPEWIVPITRGPLKERTFRIPDELVEDFLEDDLEVVARRYARTMSAEIELTRKFGRADMKDQLAEIRDEYIDLRKAVSGNKKLSKAKKEKELNRLDTYERDDIRNLEAFRDMVRGTYRADEIASNLGKATRAALTWNYIRLLGGVTLTSFSDVMRPVAVHGVRATMKEGLPQLIKTIRGISLPVNEAKELGAVTEMVLQSRLAALAELHDPYAIGSPFERLMSNASNIFSKATGLGWWNDTWKGISSVLTQNRVIRNTLVGDYSKLDKFERGYMGFLEIDENMAGRIAKMYNEFGTKDGSAFVANTAKWTDDEASRVYAAALNKDIDRTVITPGVASRPLVARSNVGKLVFQFKSFGLDSHQKILIAGLQERPHRFAEMLVGATAIGMLVAYLKFVERGDMERANSLLENPGLWVADGLDRTGLLSVPFEISNTMEKLGSPIGIKSGVQELFDDTDRGLDVSRYASRNALGAVLGPSAGLFEDLRMIAEQLSKGDLKKSGANALIRQVPGATLPGIRTGLHVGVKPALQEFVE